MSLPVFKIFLAEDDPDDQTLFCLAVNQAGIRATLNYAQNGEQVLQQLQILKNNLPDIIFLDINMPIKDGKECLKEIRAEKAFENIPVVMLTTAATFIDVSETYKSGANLYISKPLFFSDQVEIIKKLFQENWKERLLQNSFEKFLYQ